MKKREGGTYDIDLVVVNGVELKNVIFDTGASDFSLSATEALFLLKQGKIKKEDFLGTQNYMTADGKIQEGININLSEVKIGDFTMKNVKASVSNSLSAPILLGQSALQKFKKITIDNEKSQLIIEE